MTLRDSPETTTQNPGEDTFPQGRDSGSSKSGEHQDQLLSPDSLPSESQTDQNQEKPVDSGADLSAAASQWQAVWAPQYNMYYFYNPVTHETTWANPLQPEAGSSYLTATSNQTAPSDPQNVVEDAGTNSSTDLAATSQYAALQAAAIAQGIDPLLAHLDPSLRASMQGALNVPGGMLLFFTNFNLSYLVCPLEVPTFTAQFNAHTGKFAASSSRTPGHLSEYERMKRMSEFYFDVNKWEEDLAMEHEQSEASGKKRKRPTKKDLVNAFFEFI